MKPSEKTKLFISYSRKDRRRIEALCDALATQDDLKLFRDTDDILPSEEWKPRLEKLIRESDTIIFALSPQSAASEVCTWELELAESLNKRIIPIVVENVDGQVPAAVAKLNYIFLTEADDFGRGLNKIQDAISLDIDWVREHTRIGELADRWEKAMRLGAQPLRGKELEAAEGWLVKQPKDAPQPTELQRRYILESRKAATRRARATVSAALAAMVVVGVLGAFAWVQRGEALLQRNLALIERNRATDAQLEAEGQRERAEHQTDVANKQREIAESQTALAENALNSTLDEVANLLETAQYGFFTGEFSKNGLKTLAKSAAQITNSLETKFNSRADITASRVLVYSMVANILFEQAEYSLAVSHSLQALELIKSQKLNPLESNVNFLWQQVATSLSKMGEYQEAQKYYDLLLADAENIRAETIRINGTATCDNDLPILDYSLQSAKMGGLQSGAGQLSDTLVNSLMIDVLSGSGREADPKNWSEHCRLELEKILESIK